MGLRAVSLFSGAGGLDLGFERAGFEIAFANEANADSAQTWTNNRPDSANAMHVGDIADQYELLSHLESVDLVFGGPPCQGFSIAGKMDENDPRNEMVAAFFDIVALTHPMAFLMENVKALAVSARWESIRKLIADRTDELGYDIEFNVCNASHFGVPENRERMILVGVLRTRGIASEFRAQLAKRTADAPSLRSVLSSVGEFGTPCNPETCTAKVVPAKKPVKRGSAYSGMLVNGAGRPLNLSSLAPTLTASMGGNNTPIIDQKALEDPEARNWFEALYDRIGDSSYPDILVPERIRRLTIKEAAAIQTFPRSYEFAGSTCAQYRQIGNAVPCLLAEAVAAAVKDAFFAEETTVDAGISPIDKPSLLRHADEEAA